MKLNEKWTKKDNEDDDSQDPDHPSKPPVR